MKNTKKTTFVMKISTLACTLIAGLFSVSAHAAVLFENAYNIGLGGNNHFSFNGDSTIGAENFALAADSTIETISFTAHTNSALPSSIDWWIYDDSAPLAGNTIFSGSTSSYTSVVIAPYDTGGIRDYSIDVGELGLVSGNYWVGFSPNGIDGNIHWSLGTGDSLSALNQSGSWTTPYPGGAMVFRIDGQFDTSEVPVPAAAWLFGSALAGLGVLRKKK